YRSILGEWGHDRREAIYEHLAPAEPITLDPDAGNDADAATPLALASSVTDTAWVGQDEDWYVVDVPDDQHALEVTLSGVPTIDVDVALFDGDGDGDEIALESDEPSATEVTFNAVVPTGGEYFVRVTEPPSSVVFGFDTSMSIGPYTPAVLQGLVRYSGDVEQGQESVNIVPFGAEMLLDEWTDEPYLLQAAITNYPQSASSSDAEGALVMSMDELASQPGVKAVVLITDAQNASNPDLWSRLGAVQPRIFAVHLAGGTPLDQDLMEDWAAVNNGLYTYVHNQGEIDVAFDRAATILRRPSVYSLHVEATEPPPPPTTTTTSSTSTTPSTTVAPTTVPVDGFVRVLPSPLQQGQPVAVGGNASVAIILDTSGSMLQDIDGDDRINAARGALTTLVTETIPAGTNVSLRVFGATPDSCDTVLVVPQSPLDPAAMAGVIQNVPVVDGVKTPIGASLTQIANDLGTAPGPKIVVLVTDGEETCGGDPAAAIQALIDSGIDVHVNIVGFALDDEALKAQFQEWAQLGNGQYIDAGNQAELTAAVAAAVQPTFDIVDANGAVIVSGQVGGDPVAVPAGTYVLEVRSEPPQRFDITVVGTQTLELPLP
ncbi:MAG: VWA domain-containing protein, partial [Actinomycetota bacterium]|nr:VWA domain-containing protein [Actinomycetota bacterium]